MKLMLKKHGNRIYRGRMSDRVFAQIHPVRKTHLCPPNPMYIFDTSGFEWGLEFRDVETGEIIRHGGVWPTISQAREEAETINPVDFA